MSASRQIDQNSSSDNNNRMLGQNIVANLNNSKGLAVIQEDEREERKYENSLENHIR